MLKSFIIFTSHFSVLVILYGRDEVNLVGKPEKKTGYLRDTYIAAGVKIW